MPASEQPLTRLDGITCGVLVHDARGRILEANAAACRILGVEREQLLGRQTAEVPFQILRRDGSLLPFDEHPVIETLRTGKPVPDTVMGVQAPQLRQRRWIRIDSRPVFDPQSGGLNEVVTTLVDVTRTTEIEAALKRLTEALEAVTGEEFFRTLVQNLADTLAVDHVLIGEFTDEATAEVQTIAVWSDGRTVENFTYVLRHTPCEHLLEGDIRVYPERVTERFPKDKMLVELGAESCAAMAFYDPAGQPLGLIRVLHRQSLNDPALAESALEAVAVRGAAELQRRRAEEKLRRTEALYRQAIAESGSVPYQSDYRTFRYAFLGDGIQRLTGYTADELDGAFFGTRLRKVDFYGPGAELDHQERVRQARAGILRHWRADYLFERKDGSLVWLADTSIPLFDDRGNPVGSLGILTDITDRKRTEEELQKVKKLESLGLLAGGIAHDFNNILTAVTGLISLAKFSLTNSEELLAILNDAEQATLRARNLTQQLLAFARGGAPVKKAASIRDLLTESVTFALRGSNVRAELDVPEGLWPAMIDAGQIHQVINNLILNAIQAMPEGGVITVRADNLRLTRGVSEPAVPLPEGRYVRVSITDQGCGIADEDLPRIFDPYFSTKSNGSGLGLAVSYRIIKNHAGYLRVESEVGRGSTFTFYVPACGTVPDDPDSGHPPRREGHGRVLLVDDEEVVRQVGGRMLRHIGLEVDFAADGREAIEMYQKALNSGRRYQVVILDLTIPGGMGGKEAVQELRRIEPEVKAIVSSGYSNDPVMANYRKYGFAGVVSKPYNLSEFTKVVLEVMES